MKSDVTASIAGQRPAVSATQQATSKRRSTRRNAGVSNVAWRTSSA
jgi:hypothetical protein